MADREFWSGIMVKSGTFMVTDNSGKAPEIVARNPSGLIDDKASE
ncbi:MAG: hypothetical protein ACREDO_01070 [Methyloceanibacter sp.]